MGLGSREHESRRSWRHGYLGLFAAVVLAGALAAPLYAFGTGKHKEIKRAEADLVNGAGDTIGHVTFKFDKQSGVVDVNGTVSEIPPGFHGFHVHSIGSCVGPAFTSAGGHLNPGGADHPNHPGDMPVLLVNKDGTASTRFQDDRLTTADLFDSDGSAVIVHAGPDNYANVTKYGTPDATTLATGDAGARLACGVLKAK